MIIERNTWERNYNKAGNLGHPRRPPAEIHKHFASKRYNDNMKQQAEKMTKCMNVPITEGENKWMARLCSERQWIQQSSSSYAVCETRAIYQ